jgi:outer membrane protein OmpA-like peptidoglycan-associated protein
MVKKSKKESFFWTSYSDLVTSLFFVMLLLFVLAIISLRKTLNETQRQKEATQQQLDKITEIESAINSIDTIWFRYDPIHKKHVLNIDVAFQKGSANIADIPQKTLTSLISAGKSIHHFLETASRDRVKYLLIIEGQASRDNYIYNDELSYRRALALAHFWESENINFSSSGCEVIISGSGQSGTLRSQPDDAENTKNQRFLIHVIPKPGIIEASKRVLNNDKQ